MHVTFSSRFSIHAYRGFVLVLTEFAERRESWSHNDRGAGRRVRRDEIDSIQSEVDNELHSRTSAGKAFQTVGTTEKTWVLEQTAAYRSGHRINARNRRSSNVNRAYRYPETDVNINVLFTR